MRDYQSKNNNPYFLPPEIYKIVLSVIRSYDYFIEEQKDIIFQFSTIARVNSSTSNPTADKAERILSTFEKYLKAVEQALIQIPEEYRNYVLYSINCYRIPCNAYCNKKTISRYKSKLCYCVAMNLNLIF